MNSNKPKLNSHQLPNQKSNQRGPQVNSFPNPKQPTRVKNKKTNSENNSLNPRKNNEIINIRLKDFLNCDSDILTVLGPTGTHPCSLEDPFCLLIGTSGHSPIPHERLPAVIQKLLDIISSRNIEMIWTGGDPPFKNKDRGLNITDLVRHCVGMQRCKSGAVQRLDYQNSIIKEQQVRILYPKEMAMVANKVSFGGYSKEPPEGFEQVLKKFKSDSNEDSQSTNNNSQSTNNNSQPTNNNSQSTNNNSQSTNNNSQSTNNNSQSTNNNSQPTNNSQSTNNNSQSTSDENCQTKNRRTQNTQSWLLPPNGSYPSAATSFYLCLLPLLFGCNKFHLIVIPRAGIITYHEVEYCYLLLQENQEARNHLSVSAIVWQDWMTENLTAQEKERSKAKEIFHLLSKMQKDFPENITIYEI